MSEITCQRLTDGRFCFIVDGERHFLEFHGQQVWRTFEGFEQDYRWVWPTSSIIYYRDAFYAMLQREEREGDAAKLECQHCGGKILYVHMRNAAKDAVIKDLCGAGNELYVELRNRTSDHDSLAGQVLIDWNKALKRARGEG